MTGMNAMAEALVAKANAGDAEAIKMVKELKATVVPRPASVPPPRAGETPTLEQIQALGCSMLHALRQRVIERDAGSGA
jgi:hypothetical protein